jgi:hypothetical protein
MYFINEWQPNYATKLLCGHQVAAGQQAFKLMITVCQEDVACLPQAIKAAIAQAQQRHPTLLYRLWHWCFGPKCQKSRQPPNDPGASAAERGWKQMPQVKRYQAKQRLQLDCGHTIQCGETLVVTRVYTCAQEGGWPLTLLLGCLRVLQPPQSVKPPVTKPWTAFTKRVYTNGDPHRPHA